MSRKTEINLSDSNGWGSFHRMSDEQKSEIIKIIGEYLRADQVAAKSLKASLAFAGWALAFAGWFLLLVIATGGNQ